MLPDVNLTLAKPIFDSVARTFRETSRGCAFSIGLAELRPDDTPGELLARADEALYATRARRGLHDRPAMTNASA